MDRFVQELRSKLEHERAEKSTMVAESTQTQEQILKMEAKAAASAERVRELEVGLHALRQAEIGAEIAAEIEEKMRQRKELVGIEALTVEVRAREAAEGRLREQARCKEHAEGVVSMERVW